MSRCPTSHPPRRTRPGKPGKLAQLNYRHNVAMKFMPTGDPVATLRAAKALALSAGAAGGKVKLYLTR